MYFQDNKKLSVLNFIIFKFCMKIYWLITVIGVDKINIVSFLDRF